MSDGKLQSAKSCLLTRLSAAKNRKQPEKSVRSYVQKELGLDEGAVEAVVTELIGGQIVARQVKGKSISLQLTPAAEGYRKSLPPYPPPPTAQMKQLVLMEMLAAGDKRPLKSELGRLAGKEPGKSMGLSKPMMTPLLAELVGQKFAEEEIAERSGKASYRLTDQGRAEIARLWQPTPEMKNFVLVELFAAGEKGMIGAQLEKLIAKPAGKKLGFLKPMASLLGGALLRAKSVEQEAGPDATYRLTAQGRREVIQSGLPPERAFSLTGREINELLGFVGGAPRVVATSVRPAAQLSDDTLINEARDLLRERHGHTGLVPIFELRRRIGEKFGEQPASHAELDVRLKRLRREYRLRLVSISDRSRATAEQLSESVPGEEEMFFYVGELK